MEPYFTSQSMVFSLYSIVGVGVTGPPQSSNWSGRVLQAISSVMCNVHTKQNTVKGIINNGMPKHSVDFSGGLSVCRLDHIVSKY